MFCVTKEVEPPTFPLKVMSGAQLPPPFVETSTVPWPDVPPSLKVWLKDKLERDEKPVVLIMPEVRSEFTEDAPIRLLEPAVVTIKLPPPGLVKVATLFTFAPLISCCQIWLLFPTKEPVAVNVGAPLKSSIVNDELPGRVAVPVSVTTVPLQTVEEAGEAVTETGTGCMLTVVEPVSPAATAVQLISLKDVMV
jgi:hypothetical protein